MPEIQPRIFSFNNPHGACPACHGLGSTQEIDPDLVVPDHTLSISQGALLPYRRCRPAGMDDTLPGASSSATASTPTRRGATCPRSSATCS